MQRSIGWLLAFVVIASAHGAAALAEPPNPSLSARDSGVDDAEAVSQELGIADLDVHVEVVGNVAETTLTAKFVNSGRDDLEGTFNLQLPEGAVVSGYALDVEDAMI